jgi:hypothetical protein
MKIGDTGAVRPSTHFHVAQEFHQKVFSSFTIVSVEKAAFPSEKIQP